MEEGRVIAFKGVGIFSFVWEALRHEVGETEDELTHSGAVLVYDVPEAEDVSVLIVATLNEVMVLLARVSGTPFFKSFHRTVPLCW